MVVAYLDFYCNYFSGLLYVCSLDQEQKEELVHVIEKLLSDKTTLVVGSAVMAFEEVCFGSVNIYMP
jgi:Adaptin N terminal region.